jgi:2-methylcitrate dehydratase PrpD
VAAAAASCWLGGDDTATTASALAHAASMAPQLIAPDARRADGLKEGTPWSVVAGLVAVRLARAGIPAPTYLLERHPDFDQDRLDMIAPGPRPAILDTYFKRYGCCRWIHPVIDALITLNAAEPIDPASVLRVEIATFARSLTLSNLTSPTHLEEAHYSFPFCVAVAIVDGADALAPIDERLLGRPDLVALARRVGLTSDSTLERDFPAKTPAVVRVTTTAGVRELAVDTARGDPSLPFTSAVLRSKRHRLLSVQSPTAADAVEELVVGSPTVTLRRLLPILRPGTVAG